MAINFTVGRSVFCFGKVFKDGFGAIVVLKDRKPWIWKVAI